MVHPAEVPAQGAARPDAGISSPVSRQRQTREVGLHRLPPSVRGLASSHGAPPVSPDAMNSLGSASSGRRTFRRSAHMWRGSERLSRISTSIRKWTTLLQLESISAKPGGTLR
jgi:hypothetical protein